MSFDDWGDRVRYHRFGLRKFPVKPSCQQCGDTGRAIWTWHHVHYRNMSYWCVEYWHKYWRSDESVCDSLHVIVETAGQACQPDCGQ